MNFAIWPSNRRDLARHGVLIEPDDIAHVFGIELCRKRGRADNVGEHYSKLPTLGIRPARGTSKRRSMRHRGIALREFVGLRSPPTACADVRR